MDPLRRGVDMRRKAKKGGDFFIVDNSDKYWKGLQYLHDWADVARAFDIATGYFEIGSLLALDGEWQKLEKLRILMGDSVSRRTRKALLEGVRAGATQVLDATKGTSGSPNFLAKKKELTGRFSNC